MEGKGTCIVNTVLCTVGILLLLAAAFDVVAVADNMMIFLAIACFIIGAAVKRIAKGTGGSCCK